MTALQIYMYPVFCLFFYDYTISKYAIMEPNDETPVVIFDKLIYLAGQFAAI